MELMTLAKIAFTASIIVFASWLSQKKPELAGFIIALPLASLLALALAHFQHAMLKRVLPLARVSCWQFPCLTSFSCRSSSQSWRHSGSGLSMAEVIV